jgi:hypothetical protein
MLAWTLWLAVALLLWLRRGLSAWPRNGYWKPSEWLRNNRRIVSLAGFLEGNFWIRSKR